MITETPPKPSQRTRPNPITLVTDGTIAARIWMGLAVMAFAGWAVIPQATIMSLKQQQMVAIVDAERQHHLCAVGRLPRESASFMRIMCGSPA